MADLRIFSYLPNPRIYKATVAARYAMNKLVTRKKSTEIMPTDLPKDRDGRPTNNDRRKEGA